LRAQTVTPAAGWRWLATGLAIFRRNPPILSLLVVIYWFTVVFLNVLPLIGAFAASLVIPGLSVGLMQAARNIERGQPANIQTLFGGLRENTRTLLALGALYLVATLGILGLSTIIDGGDLMRYMLATNRTERAAVEDANFTLPALFVLVLLIPVLMAWWFAPVLAAWHRLTLGRALFFSFVACSMNWRAFVAYGAAVMIALGVAPGLLLAALLMVFPGAASLLTGLFMIVMALVGAPVVFASFYASYRDIFGISEIV